MSDTVRVAAAVEGPTDAVVLEAVLNALKKLLTNIEFELQTLQPEGSAAFGSSSSRTGTGWGGVYRWCRQSAEEGGGSVSGSSVLSNHDLLIIEVDADVAGKTYSSASIRDAPSQDLPCSQPCPPASGTTNALRTVILGWLGERQCPCRVVLCTPSTNVEAWVIAAVWPTNPMITRGDWECHPNPEGQLGNLPRNRRFRKRAGDYRDRQNELTKGWPRVSATLQEAARFQRELLAACPIASSSAIE